MKNLIFILGLNISIALSAQLDGTYAFTLEEAKQFALENNQEVKNAELDIKAAKKKIWETTAIGLPQVNGNINYQHIPGDIPEFDIGAQMGDLFEYIFGSFSELGYPPPSNLTDTTQGGSAIAVKNAVTYGATVSQLVFSGEYIVGLQASRTYLQISENNNEKIKLMAKENASDAYFTILTLEKNLENLDSSIINIEKLVNQSEMMKEAGFIEDIDVKQLKYNYNTIKNTRKTVKRQVDISYLLFKIQLGLSTESQIILKENLNDVMLKVNVFNYDTTNFILDENIDFKMLEVQERLSELSYKRVKSTYLPTISAFYQYQDKTEKADFDFTIKHIIGAQINIPIFSSGQRNAQLSQAKIDLQKTRNTKEMMENNIIMGTEQAINNYNNALDKYLTEKMNVDISKEIYNDTELKYKNGMASSMELTQTNTQYLESYSNYITSILSLLIAKTNLDKVYNNL